MAEEHTIVPHVTIGGALYGRDGNDIDTLRQNADLALYNSKKSGRGRFIEYSATLRTAMTEHMKRINELEAALKEDRVVAHYQPVVRLDTKEIIGVEALARLVTRDGGVVAAGYFQEALSEPRVARRLTGVMLRRVARDVARVDRSRNSLPACRRECLDGGLSVRRPAGAHHEGLRRRRRAAEACHPRGDRDRLRRRLRQGGCFGR